MASKDGLYPDLAQALSRVGGSSKTSTTRSLQATVEDAGSGSDVTTKRPRQIMFQDASAYDSEDGAETRKTVKLKNSKAVAADDSDEDGNQTKMSMRQKLQNSKKNKRILQPAGAGNDSDEDRNQTKMSMRQKLQNSKKNKRILQSAGAGNDADDSDEEKDREARRRLEAEGAANAIEVTQLKDGRKEQVTLGLIRRYHEEILPCIHNWWDAKNDLVTEYGSRESFWKGKAKVLTDPNQKDAAAKKEKREPQKADRAAIEKNNKKIRGLNKLSGRDIDAYTVPVDELFAVIVTWRGLLQTAMTLSKDNLNDQFRQHAKKIHQSVYPFLVQLRKCGLEFADVLPMKMKKSIAGSAVMPILGETLTSSMNAPNLEQTKILDKVELIISDIVEDFAYKPTLEKAIAQLTDVNKELVRFNKSNNLDDSDHTFPVEQLKDVVHTMETVEDDDSGLLVKELACAYERLWEAARDKSIPGYNSFRALTMLPSEKKEHEECLEPLSPSKSSSTRAKTAFKLPKQDDEVIELPHQTPSASKHSKKNISEFSSLFNSFDVPNSKALMRNQWATPSQAKASQLMDLAKMFNQLEVGVQVPTLDETRITPGGKLLGARAAGPGKYRVFLNTGTDDHPVFKWCWGGDYPVGIDIAKELHGKTPFESKEGKQVAAKDVKNIRYIARGVDWSAADDPRQPIYFLVEWKDEEIEPSWETFSWISHNKGRRYALKVEEDLAAQEDRIGRYIRFMIENGVDPDSGKRLTEDSLDEMPWLFSQLTIKGHEAIEDAPVRKLIGL